MTVRTFLVDAHEIVRRGVRELLETDPNIEVVGEAGSVASALRRIDPAAPDVAVLDVRLPDGSGIELCRELRERHPTLVCLILTSYPDDDALVDAVVAGAAGYVLKQVRGEDLVDAVRRVADGASLISRAEAERAADRIRRAAVRDERFRNLTPQEHRILELLADGRTNRQIASELLLSERTVKNYVSNLLSKLGMSHRTQAAVYAVRMQSERR